MLVAASARPSRRLPMLSPWRLIGALPVLAAVPQLDLDPSSPRHARVARIRWPWSRAKLSSAGLVASAGQAECKEVTDQERERTKREERIEPGGDRRTTRLQDRDRKK